MSLTTRRWPATPAGQKKMPKRAVIIDDDELSRRGMESILADNRVTVLASMSHDEFDEYLLDWNLVDVLIVDAADERCIDDHFPGVHVVEAARRRCHPARLSIIVVTRHFDDDALRRRMREAQADFFFRRSDLRSASQFCDAVLRPKDQVAGIPDPTDPRALIQMGIGDGTRVNDAIRFLLANPLGGSARRSTSRLRSQFNEVAHLHVTNADGTAPDRNQGTPSQPQINRFIEWATRSKTLR
ncbi:MAG: response regulator [Actinomycetes bacterium]